MQFEDFSQIVKNGYYFDYCVDLTFYDASYKALAKIITPNDGFKPEITVSGTMIEGGYTINSFVTVRNLSYDVDINSVSYIDCRMYYKGLDVYGASQSLYGKAKGGGHRVLFSVLYSDQEGEPPDRAVRFQCCVAATDYSRTSEPKVIIGASGSLYSEGSDKIEDDKRVSSKSGVARTLKNILVDLANIYNENVKNSVKDNNTVLERLLINRIEVDHDGWMNRKFSLGNEDLNITEVLRKLNSLTVNGYDETPPWKIFITESNSIVVQVIEPKVYPGEEEYEEKYGIDFAAYDLWGNLIGDATNGYNTKQGMTIRDAVPLNYVKGAYRNEVIIHTTTMFDDRIKPGCYCSIMGNAVMGKVGRGGGRITDAYKNQKIVFRATGAVKYEFSTVRGGKMELLGPVVFDSQVKVSQKGAGGR